MPPTQSRSHIPTQADAAKPAAGALNPNEFRAFKLIKREKLTHNTSLYRWGEHAGERNAQRVMQCLGCTMQRARSCMGCTKQNNPSP